MGKETSAHCYLLTVTERERFGKKDGGRANTSILIGMMQKYQQTISSQIPEDVIDRCRLYSVVVDSLYVWRNV